MTNRKGPQFERDLMTYLRERGLDVERLRLTGTHDEGDLLIRADADRFILEAKAEKSFDLSGYVKEAREEAENYRTHRELDADDVFFAAVVKRRQKSVGQAYVVMTLDEWLRQVYL